MSDIRPLDRRDIPDVAQLVDLVAGTGRPERASHLAAFFEQTLFDNPWADPELPSLVWDEAGEILGFVAVNVRPVTFDGRRARMVCSSHQVVHPQARSRAVGALMMAALLEGKQDLTITDGATDLVRRMWEGLGGRTVHICSLSYIRPFRPARLARAWLASRRHGRVPAAALTAAAPTLDFVARRLARRYLEPAPPGGSTRPLAVDDLLQHQDVVTRTVRLHAAYDRRYLTWLFAKLEIGEAPGAGGNGRLERGALWAESVHRGQTVVGWYVCQLKDRGFCRVLQLAAVPNAAELVVQQLAYRARSLGAIGVFGRLEPRLVPAVTAAPWLIVPSRGRLLAHARDRELLNAVLAGDALLTRLDGEWW